MARKLSLTVVAALVVALSAIPQASTALTLTRGVPSSLVSVDGTVLVHSTVDSVTIGGGYTAYGTFTSGLNIPAGRVQYDLLNAITRGNQVVSFTIRYNPALGGRIAGAATPISYIGPSGAIVSLGGSAITTVFTAGYGTYAWNPGAPWTINFQPDHITFTAKVGGPPALPGGSAVGVTDLASVPTFALYFDPSTPTDKVPAEATGAGLNVPLLGTAIGPVVPVMDIPGAKKKPDNTLVTITDKIVTAVFQNNDYFYMEEPDRRAGIRVRGATLPTFYPQTITVTGVMQTVNAEHEIMASEVVFGSRIAPVRPLMMTNKTLGGAAFAYQPAVPKTGTGLSNVGLLVRTTGLVTAQWAGAFYVDDGSSLSDALRPGLTVLPSPGMVLPPVGNYVALTGISGAETLSLVPIRVLRLRDKNDVQIVGMSIAYIYSTDADSATQFKNLLDGNGLPTDVISVTTAETADLSNYSAIVIGSDTGYLDTWGTASALANIVAVNKPVLGIGEGGYALFGKLGLFIGWPYGWHNLVDTQLLVANAASRVYSAPNTIVIPPSGILTVYDTPTPSADIYIFSVPADVDVLGKELPTTDHSVLIGQKDKYLLWGFTGPPAMMSLTGKQLFVNSVWYVLR